MDIGEYGYSFDTISYETNFLKALTKKIRRAFIDSKNHCFKVPLFKVPLMVYLHDKYNGYIHINLVWAKDSKKLRIVSIERDKIKTDYESVEKITSLLTKLRKEYLNVEIVHGWDFTH